MLINELGRKSSAFVTLSASANKACRQYQHDLQDVKKLSK